MDWTVCGSKWQESMEFNKNMLKPFSKFKVTEDH